MIAEKRKLFLVSSFFPLYKELRISIVILAAAAAVALARELFYAGMQNLPHNSICVKDPPYGRGPVQCHETSIWVYLHVSHQQPKLSMHMQLVSFKAGVPLSVHHASSAFQGCTRQAALQRQHWSCTY